MEMGLVIYIYIYIYIYTVYVLLLVGPFNISELMKIIKCDKYMNTHVEEIYNHYIILITVCSFS